MQTHSTFVQPLKAPEEWHEIYWRSLLEQHINVLFPPHSRQKVTLTNLIRPTHIHSRSGWQRGLRVGLHPLACWDYGFDSCRLHGCLSLVIFVCRGLFVGLITRPEKSECGVSECDREASIMRMPWSTRGCCAREGGERNTTRLFITNTVVIFLTHVVTTWKPFYHMNKKLIKYTLLWENPLNICNNSGPVSRCQKKYVGKH